MKDTA